jgi:anaerobic selenocysteine-containing dehydrogenase
MKYYEYEWDLEPYRILLDAELDIDKLGWHHGDYFKVVNVNGRAMLVKVDALEKFIKEGERGQTETKQIA